jgi:anti-sigma factor RsiW
MNAEVQCSQVLLLQAEFDGELDAAQSALLEAHRATCPICTRALSQMRRSRGVATAAQQFVAPSELRKTVLRRLRPHDDPRLPSRAAKVRAAIVGVGAGALAAGLLTFALLAPVGEQTAQLIVDNHLRAMQSADHLLDVASSEHHTVKPWFGGRVTFAPPVKDLEASGYPLRGGRLDVIAGRPAAVLVYQAGSHTIDVSVMPLAGAERATASAATKLRGFNVRYWSDQDFGMWAVSDLNPAELDAFVDQWKAAP